MGQEEANSARSSDASPVAAEEAVQGASDHLDRLITRLFTNPDVARIRPRTDPRFRWLHEQTKRDAPDATTLAEVVQALRDRNLGKTLEELVAYLIEYTQSLMADMLEDEFFEIVAPLLPQAADRVPILLARLGWDAGPVRTLAEAGEAAGVTRERIRQMQVRLEAKLAEREIWTPVLDRALGVIGRRAPLPAKQVGQALYRAGLSGVATFDAAGLIQAQHLFRRTRGLEIREIEGVSFIIDERSPACADITDRLSAVRTAIAKQVSRQGMASMPDIAGTLRAEGQKVADHEILALLTALGHYRVIDGSWIVPTDTESRNPLVNRLNKLLVLRAGITVPRAVAQLARDEERGYAVGEAGLRVFCRHRPDLTLANDHIYPAEPLDPSLVLSDGERAIVDAFRRKQAATLSFSELVDAIQNAGLTKVTAGMLARRSVILRKLDRDCYALIDSLPDEPDDGEVAPSATPERGSAAGLQGTKPPPTPVDLAAVAIALVRRRGAVTIAEVLEDLAQRGRHIGQGELLPFLVLAPDLIILDGRWIAGSRLMRPYPVVDRARMVMALFPGIPLRRAVSQVTRGADIVSLPRKQAIAQMLTSRDEFVVENERLFPSQPIAPAEVLDATGRFLLGALRPHPEGLSKSALSHLARDRHIHIPAEALYAALTTSPIVFSPRADIYVLCAPHEQEQLPVSAPSETPSTIRVSASTSTASSSSGVHPKWLQDMMADLDQARDVTKTRQTTTESDNASPPQPGIAAVTSVESRAVRKRIKETYDLLAAPTGIVAMDALHKKVNQAGVHLTRAQLLSAIPRTHPLTVLRETWVAALDSAQENVLTARLRYLLAVHPGIPVALARTQLLRVCIAYNEIPTVALLAFAGAHPEFSVADDRINSRTALFTKYVLSEEEHTIYRVLSEANAPCSAAEIADATRGRRRLTEDRVRQILRASVIVTPDESGRFSLVRSEPRGTASRTSPSPAPSLSSQTDEPAPPAEVKERSPSPTQEINAATTAPALADSPCPGIREPILVEQDDRRGTTSETSATIEELVRRVREQSIVLPEIQRDYVWKRTQVRDLLDSLYRDFPIGAMLMWNTSDMPVARALGGRDRAAPANGDRQFLLDGQQRLTSLSRVMFDGDPDIRFNLATEEFRVANAATRTDKRWVRVTDVFARGTIAILRDTGLLDHPQVDLFSERLDRLRGIRNRRIVINELTGFSYEDVTEIFIRVNSQGTRLRTAELAVAQLAFRLPGMVTDNLRGYEEELAERGWEIDSRFLLRCLTAVATNQVTYAGLNTVDEANLRDGWERTRQALDTFLFLVEDRLGIASTDWLPSTNAFMVPVVHLTHTVPGERDEAALLRWFLFANVRSRYSGPTETAMAQDLRILTGNPSNPFPKLVERIGGTVNGRLAITESDLDEARQGNRSLLLLSFLAMRKAGARDWWTDERMARTNLDSGQLLTIHQIFPKTVFGRGYDQQKVNEIANLVFLAQPPSREVRQAKHLAYLATIPPERLQQQFIPMQTGDWQATRFEAFLRERRKTLVVAMDEVLNDPL